MVFAGYYSMNTRKLACLSSRQQKQLSNWVLPSLLHTVERSWQAACSYLKGSLSGGYRLDWFYVGSKTCFPIFFKELSLGVLVLSRVLDQQQARIARTEINEFLKKSLKSLHFNEKEELKFPVLVKKDTEQEVLKTAHDLYLKSSAFMFLTGEELNWKPDVFKNTEGIFICIPSFHKLTYEQKEILINHLSLSSDMLLVLGIADEGLLPPPVKNAFKTKALTAPPVLS